MIYILATNHMISLKLNMLFHEVSFNNIAHFFKILCLKSIYVYNLSISDSILV